MYKVISTSTRYTEVIYVYLCVWDKGKVSPIVVEVLFDIDEETIDFICVFN